VFEQNLFDSTNPGAGAVQRQQALQIVIHNISWINEREQDIVENLLSQDIKKSKH